MFQDGKSANLMSDLKKYKLQEMGVNQSTEITNDERDYGIGAQILRDLVSPKSNC
jgi:GTP cyclohydrolase II